MPRRSRLNPAVDLFGEVPVSWEEVYTWTETVAGISRHSWRAAWYIRHWDVPGKVAREKRARQLRYWEPSGDLPSRR